MNTDLGLCYFCCVRAFLISLVSALKYDIHAILSPLFVLHRIVGKLSDLKRKLCNNPNG